MATPVAPRSSLLVSLFLLAVAAGCAKGPQGRDAPREGASTQLTAASTPALAATPASDAGVVARATRVVVATPTSDAAPGRPSDRAPVRFEVLAIDSARNELEVRAYNFSDRALAAFDVIVRYRDASGKPLLMAGSEVRHYSASGLSYRMAPKSWTRLLLDNAASPAGATTAEILLREAKGIAKGGLTLDPVPVFTAPFTTTWPEPHK
jgi:hypothetical protein